ncbi:MAG: PLP-dependent aspartate aminotransferase family protein [Pirellulaceae bacterium]
MTESPNRHQPIDDLCAKFWQTPSVNTTPHSPPIYLASVYACDSPAAARDTLTGKTPGYVYQRDGHPNGDMLAQRCRDLHGATWCEITSSGMSAYSALMLATCTPGDHLLLSQDLYGRSLDLLDSEATRWGMTATRIDTSDLSQVRPAIAAQPPKLLVVETISNPTLKLADLPQLAELCHAAGTLLVVDNTFASPYACQPLRHGADFVVESLTKIMNGHADGLLGMIAGSGHEHAEIRRMLSIWGLTAGAFDCWLAARGLSTLHLRADRAADNAQQIAGFLATQPAVETVLYPGLPTHPQHQLAQTVLPRSQGTIVTFTLSATAGQEEATAARFIENVPEIPFCPSLGDLSTTLSHPASTSHRNLTPQQLAGLGISGATIRLSVGVESAEFLVEVLARGVRK